MKRKHVLLLCAAMAAGPAQAIPDPSRDVLWVALQGCILMKETTGRTFPCLSVDLGHKDHPGTAVMRAPGEPTHIIVMPTRRTSGIEAPDLQHNLGNVLWRAALANRHRVTDALKDAVPVEDVGIAINSMGGRSQDQLHIHVDCINPIARAALRDRTQHVQGSWVVVTPTLLGSRFFAMRVKSQEAESFNPFVALARVPGRTTGLRDVTFAAFSTPSNDPDKGYILLAYRSSGSHAEKLLDHTCAIASKTAAR